MIYVIYDVNTFKIFEFCFSEADVISIFSSKYFGVVDSSGQCIYNWKCLNLESFLQNIDI